MTELNQIDTICKNIQLSIDSIRAYQNDTSLKLRCLNELLNNFDKQLIEHHKKNIIIIDCRKLRESRQISNNANVLVYLKEKNIRLIRDNCNTKELDRVLKLLNMTESAILCKCDDADFATLLSCKISINSSRQGIKDEHYILKICNTTSSLFGVYINKLSNNEYRPSNNGKIVNILDYKKMKKHDCLKSFDGKISGKINGWVFAKITFESGGHQDNVFEEAHQMCKWVIKYCDDNSLFVILIDTNLKKQFNMLKNSYTHPNLLITDHIGLQEYVINNF